MSQVTFGGYRVFVSPDLPRMQLGERVKEFLTPEQIADHNAWMLQFFGTSNLLGDDVVLRDDMFMALHMNPRVYPKFIKANSKS